MTGAVSTRELQQRLPFSLRRFLALQKREFLDHQTGFFTVPLVVLALIMALWLVELIWVGDNMSIRVGFTDFRDIRTEIVRQFGTMTMAAREVALKVISASLALTHFVILGFVILFALLGSLYDDRRNRSYLFWKSMPVSDTEEVLSKLAAAALMAPLITIGFAIVLQIFFGIIATVFVWAGGGSAWDLIWAPMSFIGLWSFAYGHYLVYALWALPVLGWLLFASAVAPRAPLMIAVIAPVAIGVGERLMLNTYYFGQWLADLFGVGYVHALSRAADNVKVSVAALEQLDLSGDEATNAALQQVGGEVFKISPFEVLAQSFADPAFYVSLAAGTALIAGAIWLRKNRV